MKKEDKTKIIDHITQVLKTNQNVYLADLSGLNSSDTYKIRKLCFENNVSMKVVKNTFLKIAMVNSGKNFEDFFDSLSGNSCLMLSESPTIPASVILKMRKSNEVPKLKAALVQDVFYNNDKDLKTLSKLKSKEELISDVVFLLKSTMSNLIGSLESSKNNIFSVLKSLGEKK